MKILDLLMLQKAIDDRASIANTKFSYALNKNFRIIEQELKAYEELRKKKYFDPFEKRRIEIAKIHCDKDESGEPIIVDNQFKFTEENKKIYTEETRKLNDTEFKDIIKELNDICNEEMKQEVTFHMISEDKLPENFSLVDRDDLKLILEK